METKPSLSVQSNQNWLLSYTDLFLLVLSFFVLRFSILKYDIHPTHVYKEEVSAPIKEPGTLLFKVASVEHESATTSIQTSIKPGWFSDTGLSTKGEREISNLGKRIEESKKKATLKLHKIQGIELAESNQQIVLLIENLKALGLSSLKIEMTLKNNTTCGGSTNEHALACLVLDF